MGADVRFAPATPELVASLAASLREADARECERLGLRPADGLAAALERSAESGALLVGGEVAAMWGLAPVDLLAGVASPWVLTTPAVERARLTYVRGALERADRWAASWPVLYLWVDPSYVGAVRLLRLARFAPTARAAGADGAPLEQWVRRQSWV